MAGLAGINMEGVRRSNRASILKYINDNGPTSRKDLAAAIGLTPAAVTQICADLMDEGILLECGQDRKKKTAGRKQIFLDINFDVAYVYGINMEARTTVVSLCNLRGNCLGAKELPTDGLAQPEAFLRQVASTCLELKATLLQPEAKVLAASVGIVGAVNKETGRSLRAYGIWNKEVPVREILKTILHMPVYVENNVNAFAVAELLYGYGKTTDHLMLLKWGPGVGCAMITNGNIYEGGRSKAAELGHFIVEPEGKLCRCGRRGCLETKISYQALQTILPFEEEDWDEAYCGCTEVKTKEKLQQVFDLFARTIVNTATMMAPDRIVLTGSLFSSEAVQKNIVEACRRYDASFSEERIVASNLRTREDYIGPVAVCVKDLLFT